MEQTHDDQHSPQISVHSLVAALVAPVLPSCSVTAVSKFSAGQGLVPVAWPSGLGKAAGDGEVALKWSSKKNVIWRTAVPDADIHPQ